MTQHGVLTGSMDLSVNPKDDFYGYACGGWMKDHPLAPEFSRYGLFDHLREQNRDRLKELITGLTDNPESKISGTIAQKISDLYAMGMDEERLNREGAAPVMPIVEKINSSEAGDLTDLLSWLHLCIASPFFSSGVGVDMMDSNAHILSVSEGALGLGDRDYYLETSERNETILKAYETYIRRIMELLGYSEEGRNRVWDNVISIERHIAGKARPREDWRNPHLRYNPMAFDIFRENFPAVDWERYFTSLGIDTAALDKINVLHPEYLKEITGWMLTLDFQAVKDYLVFHAVDSAVGVLSDDFGDASFELYGRVMSGAEQRHPRWKRAMGVPTSMFGEAVGQLYVEKYFPKENKEAVISLVENLRKALRRHIETLEWMSDPTKTRALEKLSKMSVKIGYPDKWKDYSEINIDPAASYHDNVLAAARWFAEDNLKKLNKPVDKEEWHMYPQTVNAYYSPVSNEICFPAAILQPPYFDINAAPSLNYGAIGVVIGHEMTHGFDDQGRKFDVSGNLKDWWTEEDASRFNALADVLVMQFDEVEVAPGQKANGRYTLGENIADQGGLRIALTAYKDFCEVKDDTLLPDDGFTPVQRFYISYAQMWASNIRPEEILSLTQTDTHSLGKWRVDATLRNIDEFLDAFSINSGDPMFLPREQRVTIW